MTVSLSPIVKQTFYQNGSPLANGKLFTYSAGTTNKLSTFTDSTGSVQNTNPIILDANGQADVWMTVGTNYKLVLSPSTDTDPPTNAFWTEDNISPNLVATNINGGTATFSGLLTANGGITTTTITATGLITANTLTASGTITSNAALNETKSTDIASAATVNIGAAAGNFMHVTGTTTITAFDTVAAGVRRILEFTAALTLTHNATSLILPSAANITTAAGDVATFVSEGSGNWRCVDYMLASGKSLVVAAAAGVVQGSFKNLKIVASGLTNTSAVLTADEISLEDSSNNYFTARTVNVTINSTASGANGLDTGTVAASTWYSVWAIYNGTTVSGLLSLSTTSPTMPGGYTFKSRLGWVRTDGTGNKYLLQTVQNGRRAQYVVLASSNVAALPQLGSGASVGSMATPTWVAIGVANFVPPTASVIWFNTGNNNTAGSQLMVAPNNQYGNQNSTTNPPFFQSYSASGTSANGVPSNMSLESTNIYWATANSASLYCSGWEENI